MPKGRLTIKIFLEINQFHNAQKKGITSFVKDSSENNLTSDHIIKNEH